MTGHPAYNSFSTRHVGTSVRPLSPALCLASESFLVILLVALLYKLTALGFLCMLALSAIGLLGPINRKSIQSPLALLGFGYVIISTVTALRVDLGDGIVRSVQCALILMASISITNYFIHAPQQRTERTLKIVFAVSGLVFAHLIFYHVRLGDFSGWKRLADTKASISLVVIFTFMFKNRLANGRMGTIFFYFALGILALLVFLSGERKAYLLLAACFFLSNISPLLKGASLAAVLPALLIISQSEGYLANQVNSILQSDGPELALSELQQINNLTDYSDLVREFVNANAWQLFLDQPILGVGSTGYQAWAKETYGLVGDNGGLSMNVHGEIYRIPAEAGILGIAITFFMIWSAVFELIRFFKLRTDLEGSFRRAPAYFLVFLFIYAATEALDTTLLLMIATFCSLMSVLPSRRPGTTRMTVKSSAL